MRKRKVKPAEHQEEDEEEKGKEGKGFYACYLLTSLCPRFKGHTYIGFTVNPRRRIRQHNGEIRCGAFRTKKRRPWEMVFCIYGFPTNVSALQFEWAWQHPMESLAVRQAAATFKSFSGVANKIKLAYTMLNLPAWQSLNMTVNYFSTKYSTYSSACTSLPEHMKVQVCPIDELPCYTVIGESEFECRRDAEDDFDDRENNEYTTSVDGQVTESMTELQFHSSDEFPRGKEIASEEDDGSNDGCKDDTLNQRQANTIIHASLDTSHIDATYEKFGLYEEYSMRQPSLKNISADSPEVEHEQPFGFMSTFVGTASSISNGFSMNMSSDGDMLASTNILTGKDDKDQLIPQEIEVIDLLSPSPDCRIISSRKRRKVVTICPQIIDLT